jgi:hypothetical protein
MALLSETGVGRGTITVIHDADRCYGFLRQWGNLLEAWSSDDSFHDCFIGEFRGKREAITALKARFDTATHEMREKTRRSQRRQAA